MNLQIRVFGYLYIYINNLENTIMVTLRNY